MESSSKIKWLGVVFYLLLQIAALAYGRNLGQENVETLFFPGGGLKDYQQFLGNFEEQKLLLVKVGYPHELSESSYGVFKKKIEALREAFSDVEILTFFDLYQKAVKQDDLESARTFLQKKPDLSLKLMGPDALLFLAIFHRQSSPQQIDSFLSKIQSQEFFGNHRLQMAGLPYINELLDRYSRDINTRLFPILFLVVFAVTLAFTRNFLNSILLFVPALGSLGLTLALVKLFYASMNMVTTIVPLLIFVLNLSLALHFYYAFLEYGSMSRALHEKKIPFILMVSATAIGFGSLALSDIPAIRQFGVLSFPAILCSSALTFLWAYSLFPWRIQKDDGHSVGWIPRRWFAKTWKFSTILFLSVALIAASTLLFPRIPLNTDATTYFPKGSGLEKDIRSLENELMGIPILEIDLAKKNGSALDWDDLIALDSLESQILQAFGGQRRILSANQLVREANYLYTGEKKFPPFELSYWTLKSQAAPLVLRQYPQSAHYRLTFFGPSMNDKPYQAELRRIQKIMDGFPQFSGFFTGIYFQIMHSQSSLIWILTASFLLRFLVIAFLFYLYFRRLKLLFIFLLANELPVFGCVLFLFFLRFSLNVATVMVFPVAIGIVVGNTLHVIYALSKKPLPSFGEYFQTIIIPILIGSTTLISGFSLLGFYGFLPIQQFGAALAFTVLLGMFSALYLVPTLVLKSPDLVGSLGVKESQE